MINQEKLKEVLEGYKENFTDKWWKDVRVKWEAVKCFQDHWDVNAEDFVEMFLRSLDGVKKLVDVQGNIPRSVLKCFAQSEPEKIRAIFIDLFDENQDLITRIETFKKQSKNVFDRVETPYRRHYQDEKAISIYLWMRYPDKYYIYKLTDFRNASKYLESDYLFEKHEYAYNVRNYSKFYDEIREGVKNDQELLDLVQGFLDENCYPDPEMRTLTADVANYINKKFFLPDSLQEGDSYELNNEDDISSNLGLESYTKEDFLNDVYMPSERYDALAEILQNKKNIILQGPPGVGKTFAARRLAYSVMGCKDKEKIEFVQFHQNYSYEDFVQGYKPTGTGFELRNGIFYRFCGKAAEDPDKKYFFIIDEINRGNMSKIFGELLMLIEKDYRGLEHEITMSYSQEKFYVPENLYIIGMMNTADRSLAMIDYALRRRFSFFDMEPGFDSVGFSKYRMNLKNEIFDALIDVVKELNIEIEKTLGKGFRIGHSYFCGQTVCTEDWMRSVVEYDIIPMLSEYWFDDDGKLTEWSNKLRGVFQ